MSGGRMQESISTHSTKVSIAATHPSLPGHFPGRPLVPGVLLLDEVLNAAELWLQRVVRVRSLRQAKFTAPLLPDQSADLLLTLQGTALRFAITRADEAIAQGVLEVALEVARERGA
jgi:3-hydroxymyristoyl/3-hydroxydecanoyl-(acyl carrier protein) dehydratase